MSQTETADLLERVNEEHEPTWSSAYGHRCSCGDLPASRDERAFDRHVAEMQAAALAEAAEGTITISTEGLPSRAELLEMATSRYTPLPAADVIARLAVAMPEPTPPLPTATWSVVTDQGGDVWVLREDGRWQCSIAGPEGPEQLVAKYGPITVRHDAGADQ